LRSFAIRETVAADIDIGCTVSRRSAVRSRRRRDGARESRSPANKFQNIRGSADTLLDLAGIGRQLAPVADAIDRADVSAKRR
jgi:hypothetical protein